MCTSAHVEARGPPGGGVESSVRLGEVRSFRQTDGIRLAGPCTSGDPYFTHGSTRAFYESATICGFYVFWGLNARCQASP